MRKVVLGLDEDGIVELATSQARRFKELAAHYPGTARTFQYSPEMFSGTELAFSRRGDAVTEVWQPTPERKCIINLPSTVEHSTPNIFADMIEWMHRHLARRDAIKLSVHPHNDRGTGTAAAELALMAGADRIEAALFGNGERTGNLDLVNVALNPGDAGRFAGTGFLQHRRDPRHRGTLQPDPGAPAPPLRGRSGLHVLGLPPGRHQEGLAARSGRVIIGTCRTCPSIPRTWAAATRR